MTPLRKVQLGWLAASAMCLTAAGLLQEPRATYSDLAEVVPGRAFLVTYLSIRADAFKEQGRIYDALQQAKAICRLQRRFPGVWAYHAWNMAWNISVTANTPQERWQWVHNGLRLLRDEGIPLNRKSIILYRELGWIFLMKMGGYLDDMHWVYKRQWAARMQDLLAAPPDGPAEHVIAAFRPVAEAPLDKDYARQGSVTIQPEMARRVLADPTVRAYADLLAAQGVGLDESLLAAYNRYSMDDAVRSVRLTPPRLDTDKANALYSLINDADPAHAEARRKLLAFVRAQVLWNVYKMDPAWMLAMMERYGPLDWRLPQPHGIYWLTLGRYVCNSLSLADVDSLNTDRTLFNCLQDLTREGRLVVTDERPRESTESVMSLEPREDVASLQLDEFNLFYLTDLRYVEKLHAEFLHTIKAVHGASPGDKAFGNNHFRDGHINYLAAAARAFYAGYQRREAQKWFDWIKTYYAPQGPEWKYADVEDFVLYYLRNQTDPSREMAHTQIVMASFTAYAALARGEAGIYADSLAYVRKVHQVYHRDVRNDRMRLPALDDYAEQVIATLLVSPRLAGFNLSLADRHQLYTAIDDGMQRRVYPQVAGPLRLQCQQEKLDFDKAFPPPRGSASPSQP